MIDVVRGTVTDGQVYDWVRTNVKRSDEFKAQMAAAILRYPLPGDTAGRERFRAAQTGVRLGRQG